MARRRLRRRRRNPDMSRSRAAVAALSACVTALNRTLGRAERATEALQADGNTRAADSAWQGYTHAFNAARRFKDAVSQAIV